jgi:hypothetical protein
MKRCENGNLIKPEMEVLLWAVRAARAIRDTAARSPSFSSGMIDNIPCIGKEDLHLEEVADRNRYVSG